jgi:integrase
LKRQLDPIHNLFEVAKREWGLPIKENPLANLNLKAPTQKRERRLQPGEEFLLFDAAKSCRNKLIEPIIRLALATGMRRGEILAIKKRDVDFNTRLLLLEETKNGYSRHVPLTGHAVAVLQERSKRAEGKLFPITANAFRLAWDRVKGRASIDDLHFHDLRHEAISRFFEMGLSMPEVASISGHRDARMLLRYAHAEKQNVIRKLDHYESV